MTQFLSRIGLLIIGRGVATTVDDGLVLQVQNRHFSGQGDPMLVAILISMAISALALMSAFPETPTGKWLHRMLAEAPARFLLDFTWAKFGRMLLIAGAAMLLASMGPEMLLLMAASGLDAAALVEVMLIVWAASVSGGITGVGRSLMRLVSGISRIASAVLPRPNRSRRPRRNGGRRPRKADDLDEPGWAFA
jgi:hypothetical protein